MLEPGRLLRVKDIIGDKRRGIPPIIPVARSTWHLGVAQGRFPKPIRIGPNTTVWRSDDIIALVNQKHHSK